MFTRGCGDDDDVSGVGICRRDPSPRIGQDRTLECKRTVCESLKGNCFSTDFSIIIIAMLTDKFNKFFRLNFGCSKQVPSKLQANRFLTVQEEQEPRARVCLLDGIRKRRRRDNGLV